MMACDWRVLASEMRDRAEKCYRRDCAEAGKSVKGEWFEEVRNLWWYKAMDHMKLPYYTYFDDDREAPIPPWIKEELNGRA